MSRSCSVQVAMPSTSSCSFLVWIYGRPIPGIAATSSATDPATTAHPVTTSITTNANGIANWANRNWKLLSPTRFIQVDCTPRGMSRRNTPSPTVAPLSSIRKTVIAASLRENQILRTDFESLRVADTQNPPLH